MRRASTLLLAWLALALCPHPASAQQTLLNVSYDPTRELYADINAAFQGAWEHLSGNRIVVHTTNGGSGMQTRAVLEGEPADVVTLALAPDIDELVKAGLVAADWDKKFPNRAVPYTSVAVFLVRRGNPRRIHDWGDLARDGVSIVTPDPKTSGGGRWNFMAALAWAQRQPNATAATQRAYLHKLYANVAVLDAGARGATNSFVQRGIGDVLIAAEHEAHLSLQAFGGGGFQIVYPPVTIEEDAPVAIVDRTVGSRNDRPVAEAYLNFLWSEQAQQIAARHYFRPRDPALAAAFPKVIALDIGTLGGWTRAQNEEFGPGGLYDQITAGLAVVP